MILTEEDFMRIQHIVFKNGDDLAVSFARICERLEERIDAAESRLYSRLADIEEKIDES